MSIKPRPHKDLILAGVDIGSSKIAVVVGELNEDNELYVSGVGSSPSHGVKKGRIVDIESTIRSIRDAIKEAEMMAGCSIREVFVNVSGNHIHSLNSSGVVPLNQAVCESDIRHVLEAARAVQLKQNMQLLHTLPQQFIVDDQDRIMKPLGMSGVRLEARVHLVTGAATCIENISRCVSESRLRTEAFILSGIAASEALLKEDERYLGVALVDIGAGTTDITLIESGSVLHTAVLPLGGSQITEDLAGVFGISMQEAERLKIRYGCASSRLVRKDEIFTVPSLAGRRPLQQSRSQLTQVIEPRIETLFQSIMEEIKRSGYENILPSGLVLTGGCTNLEGICEIAEEVTGMPVKRGLPQQKIGGLGNIVRNPTYSTAIGLLLYGLRLQHDPYLPSVAPSSLYSFKNYVSSLYRRVAAFFA